MRTIRDMIGNLMSERHDGRKYPWPRHKDRLRDHIRYLINLAKEQDKKRANFHRT